MRFHVGGGEGRWEDVFGWHDLGVVVLGAWDAIQGAGYCPGYL